MKDVDTASHLMSSLLHVYFRPIMIDAINATKTTPKELENGYKLSVTEGELNGLPTVLASRPMQVIGRGEAAPYIYTLELDVKFAGTTTLKASLEGESIAQVNLYFDLKGISITSKVYCEVSPGLGYIAWYFVERPDIEWDLEVQVTKAKLDVPGEQLVEHILEGILDDIDGTRPQVIDTEGSLKQSDPDKYERLRALALASLKPEPTLMEKLLSCTCFNATPPS